MLCSPQHVGTGVIVTFGMKSTFEHESGFFFFFNTIAGAHPYNAYIPHRNHGRWVDLCVRIPGISDISLASGPSCFDAVRPVSHPIRPERAVGVLVRLCAFHVCPKILDRCWITDGQVT